MTRALPIMQEQRGGQTERMSSAKCSGCENGFPINTEDPISILPNEEWLESKLGMFRVWHVIFMVMGSIMSVIVCICCCVRFRIPRTKQEIEADYVRKKITRKFQKQLRMINNSEMDEMDLKRALDRVRAEFKSDTDSLAQSEAFSISSGLPLSPNDDIHDGGRKGSNVNIGVSIEELIERRNSGLGSKIASFVGSFNILRWRNNNTSQQPTKMGV